MDQHGERLRVQVVTRPARLPFHHLGTNMYRQGQGRIPIVVVISGADNRSIFATGKNSKVNQDAVTQMEGAIFVEVNHGVSTGAGKRKDCTWKWTPQPWIGEMVGFLKASIASSVVAIGYSRGSSWLIQLTADCPGTFDRLVLMAPYPPPGRDEDTQQRAFLQARRVDNGNLMIIGADADECGCTEQAHPKFWAPVAVAAGSGWYMVHGGHGALQSALWFREREGEAQTSKLRQDIWAFVRQ